MSQDLYPHVDAQFVKRPGFGQSGEKTKVLTNSLFVNAFPLAEVYHYDVVVQPEVPPAINREVMVDFAKLKEALGDTKPVFDGRKNLFSPRKLGSPTTWDGQSKTWTFPVTESDGRPSKEPRMFTVQLNLVAVIQTHKLKRFCMGELPIDNEILTAITALNVLIRHQPTILYPSNARSFFHDAERIDLQGAVELWRGYFQSIRPTIGRMVVNLDISAGAFIARGSLISVCLKFLGAPNDPNLLDMARLPDRERIRLDRFLRGVKIRVIHRGEEHKKMKLKIKKLSDKAARDTTFTPKDSDQPQKVAEYFQATYNRPLNHEGLPTVEVRKGVMLPLEVCDVLPGQQFHQKLNADQTANALRFTTMHPRNRVESIQRAVASLKYKDNEFLQDFGLTMQDKLVDLEARLLKPPMLKFGTNGRYKEEPPRDGGWSFRDKEFFKAATLSSWAIVVFSNPGRQDAAEPVIQEFVRSLIDGAREVGLTITQKDPLISYCGRDVRDGLLTAGRATHDRCGSLPELIVCILPNKGAELYGIIKGLGDTDFGVPTQCLQLDKVRRTNRQYIGNVLLKINAKLGGTNSAIDDANVSFVTEKPTMVFGIDSTHPSPGPGAHNRPTISALVGSMDRLASRYEATVRVQEGRVEIVADLEDMVLELLERFVVQWNRPPERLLFYRDGASEGQFKEIIEKEVGAIHIAAHKLGLKHGKEYKPTVTYVVAGKRHHIRFFPEAGKSDRSGNCHAGTVIDTKIVHPHEFDFYLQSHGGLLGTSRPTHYSVLVDENKMSADTLQQLSWALCHNYCRATRSVSIVAPAYYCELVATRARFHLGGESFDDAMTSISDGTGTRFTSASAKAERLARFKSAFRPVKEAVRETMYWA